MIKADCPPAYPGLWVAYKEIIPALLRQRRDSALQGGYWETTGLYWASPCCPYSLLGNGLRARRHLRARCNFEPIKLKSVLHIDSHASLKVADLSSFPRCKTALKAFIFPQGHEGAMCLASHVG